jgi:DNA-binding XRE family transcriptional regulator
MVENAEVCGGAGTSLSCKRSSSLLQFQDNAMDLWSFKKWRTKLGYTQAEAAEKLGLSRGAVQYWESEIRLVPPAVKLACEELLRQWKQRPEFGPVTLLYAGHADDPTSLKTSVSVGNILVRSERHPDIENAMKSATRQRESTTLFVAFIVEDDGNVIWSGPELLREIDARKNVSIGGKTSAAKTPSSR